MPRIVTGQISYASAVRNTTDNTYTHGSRAYFGSEGGTSGIENIYVLYFTPVSGELQDVAENEINMLRIRLTLKKKTTLATDSEFSYKIFSEAQTWSSPRSLYDIVDGEDSYTYARVDFANKLEEQEIVISLTGTAAYYAARYGFSMSSLTLGDLVDVTSYSMEADVSDSKVPPVIELINGFGRVVDGKYWHYPENEFTLNVHYSQELDEPIYMLNLHITIGGYTSLYQGAEGRTSVTVPDSVWKRLPTSGTIKLEAWTGAGVFSNAIEMPFEVAMYDIRYTSHASGSIIQSDEDAVITWEAYRPERLPASVYMAPPTQYIRYIWWDDNDLMQGEYTTDTSYTIPAETLEAHSVLHIAVAEVYGSGTTGQSKREPDYAPVLNLYIQQVAGIGDVTVSPKRFTGIYFPRITVSWESTGQAAYQVKIGDIYDSGPVWGKSQSHNVQKMLDNGTHTVQVRVQDISGTWGEWTEPLWITVYEAQDAFNSIKAENTGNAVDITVELDDSFEYETVLIYRNDVMIAQLPASDEVIYTDRTANKNIQYFARCVSATSGAYHKTETITVDAYPNTDGIFLPDGTWVALRYTTSAPRRYQTNVSEETYAKYYAGRSYPVYMRSGRKMRELSMAYADVRNELADLLENAVGETVIYKNRLGQVIHGELNQISAVRGRHSCEVSFVIAQADFTDEIPYTW